VGALIDWEDVANRYPAIMSVGGAREVGSAHIVYAEAELNSMLTGYFTTPFSSNNVTARDCAIELTYLRLGTLKIKEEEATRKRFMVKIEMLKSGESGMVLDDGTVLRQGGDMAYSSDDKYEHTFSVGPIEDDLVDPDKLRDIADERR